MWFERIPERREAWQYTGDIELLPDELLPVIRLTGGPCFIMTPQGLLECAVGDWIIRDGKGEIYVCRDDIFRLSYRPAPEQNRS